tara:strand:+ start:10038 stop:10175 length:138 start_codon:yes stop_codon:yes gene_type:complete
MKKRKLNSKNPKYHKDDKDIKKVKKTILLNTTKDGVKIYGIWYED